MPPLSWTKLPGKWVRLDGVTVQLHPSRYQDWSPWVAAWPDGELMQARTLNQQLYVPRFASAQAAADFVATKRMAPRPYR